MAGQAGYRASVYIAQYAATPVLVRAHRWSVDWKVDDFDTTSFMNYGIGQYIGGLTDFDLAFDCYWFQADNPHNRAVGPDIGPGEMVSLNITFGPAIPLATPNTAPSAINSVPAYFFGRCLITNMHTETSVRDVIRFNFACRVSVETEGDVAVLTVPLGTSNSGGSSGYSKYRPVS